MRSRYADLLITFIIYISGILPPALSKYVGEGTISISAYMCPPPLIPCPPLLPFPFPIP